MYFSRAFILVPIGLKNLPSDSSRLKQSIYEIISQEEKHNL